MIPFRIEPDLVLQFPVPGSSRPALRVTLFCRCVDLLTVRRDLDAFVGQGYGIFSGASVQWAKLRFSAERARWVSSELWHSAQRASVDVEGRYVLELPFTDMRELVMDILRHGRHVEVLEPRELRAFIKDELREALANY